jgi:hypothetical protein
MTNGVSGISGGGKPANVVPLHRFSLQTPVKIKAGNVVKGPDGKMQDETVMLPAGTVINGAKRNGGLYVKSYTTPSGKHQVFKEKGGKRATPLSAKEAEAVKYFQEGMGKIMDEAKPGKGTEFKPTTPEEKAAAKKANAEKAQKFFKENMGSLIDKYGKPKPGTEFKRGT